MRTHTTKRRGGFALAGVAAVALMGGSAFTDGMGGVPAADTRHVGYGTTDVSGGTVTTFDYKLSADGSTITSLDLTLQETYTEAKVTATLNGTAMTAAATANCTITNGKTTSCTFSPAVETANVTTTSISIDGTVDTTVA